MFNIGDDNELDRLSREAAEKYMHPVNSGWDAISAELDKVMPVKEEKKRRGLIFWWLFPALVAGGAIAWWAASGEHNNSYVPVKAITASSVKPGGGTTAANNTAARETTNPQIKTDQPITQELLVNRAPVPAGDGSKKMRLSLSRPSNSISMPDRVSFWDDGGTKVPVIHPAPAQKTAATSAITTDLVQQNNSAGNANPGKVISAPPVETAANSDAAKSPAAATDSSAHAPAATKNAAKKATVQPSKQGKGFSYEILAGVDESTVKFTYGKGPGYNLGAVLGYHFNDKLSIHAGAIYTQKNYKLAGVDFTPPKGSAPSYYKIETVDGYCRMWDIPVFLRYTVSQSAKHSVFLDAGLSSYFMTDEDYDYLYYNGAGMLVSRNAGYNSSDRHVLSILSLSAGFGNRIGRNWSMNIEPYAKIPLGGVGFGSIHLSSFGLNVSFQHRQPAKK